MTTFKQLARIVTWFDGLEVADRAWWFSHIVVPVTVAPFVLSNLFGASPLPHLDELVTFARLHASIAEDGEVRAREGVVIIAEQGTQAFGATVTTEESHSVWVSLDLATAQANSQQIVRHRHGINLRPPLLGVRDPIVLVTEGTLGDEIMVANNRLPANLFQPTTRRSPSLAFAAAIGAAFAFGFTASAGKHEG